jgi:serine/threonine-protein kinase
MASSGQRIGEYLLDARIGAGAFGEVWRARHHVWVDQIVAVKIPTDEQYIRNLQREGAAMHGLVHPNIARALGFDPYADPPYLITEFVPGTSLRPLIDQRKLSPADAAAVMVQVLRGLGFAHARGVLHRDIKPENILVHERAVSDGYAAEGVIKVTDFGLGRAAMDSAAIKFSASVNTPQAREIAGTLDYMAPEIRNSDAASADARADLYACGVVLYEMLTGERPAGTEVPSEMNRQVPRYLDEVFRRSYTRLERRFASAEEFLAALAAGSVPALPETQRMSGATVCPHCSKPVGQDDQFCMSCGVQLVAHVRRCQQCGAYPDLADRYCIFCGQTLDQPLAVVT